MNFYEVLDVSPDADEAAIKRAFRDRARRFHPDVNAHPAANDQFTVLARARDVLLDEEERAAYDRLGHRDYVAKRMDGDFPSPEMTPEPTRPRSEISDDGPPADPTSVDPVDSTSGTGASSGGADTPADRPGDDTSATVSGATRSDESSGSSTEAGATAEPAADAGVSTEQVDGDDDTATTTSTPPTPGSEREARSRPRESTPGRRGRTPTAARKRRASATSAANHLTVSLRWVSVVVVGAVYGAGVAGYLRAGSEGVDRLAAALTSGELAELAAALGGARYGVDGALAFAAGGGLVDGLVPTGAGLLLVGALLLPATMAGAVSGLRSETYWRPSWLHVVGSLGPLAALGIEYAAAAASEAMPLAAVPLVADLLLLVVVPGVAVASFLVNRLVLVLPLRARETAAGD